MPVAAPAQGGAHGREPIGCIGGRCVEHRNRALDAGSVADFENLFGKQGACYGCWCTHFRLRPKVRQGTPGEGRKEIMRARIEAGPPPGLLAFVQGMAVGWMQIGPRADVPEWNNAGRCSAPVDGTDARDPGVWAISCFFLRPSVRRQGLTHRMVAAGLDHARARGARLVEACPMTLSRDSRSIGLFVGSKSVFDKAGFRVVAERKPGRPLMRFDL